MAKHVTREEYIGIIGFFGNTALIDRSVLKKVKKLSFERLLDKNMIRECVCDALYTNDEDKKRKVCTHYFALRPHTSDDESTSLPTPHDTQQDDYMVQFKSLVQEYGVLEEVLHRELRKKYM